MHDRGADLQAGRARAMNSAASRHVAMPPMPEIGKPTSGSAAQACTILSAIGFTAGPQ